MIGCTLGFIGYGNMGSAILEGMIEAGAATGKHAVVFDPAPARRDAAAHVGAALAATALEAARTAGVVVLAVKPQQMEAACAEIRPAMDRPVLAVSIAAGIGIGWLRARLGPRARVVRTMPNTPALVQAGATGIALAPECTAEDAALVRTMFEALGIAEIVPEAAIDAVTALSGSGPAYFFQMVEHLIEAAAAEGLDPGAAARLAAQTLYGAGQLLRTTGEPAGVLRARVTSPGGTTQAALESFRAAGFDTMVHGAVQAAVRRARELGA